MLKKLNKARLWLFNFDNYVYFILCFLFFYIKKEHGVIHTILSWENYILGILCNIIIFHYISEKVGVRLRKIYGKMINWICYRYIWNEEQKERYDDLQEILKK